MALANQVIAKPRRRLAAKPAAGPGEAAFRIKQESFLFDPEG
jgi:hypothetical protein